MNSLSLPTPPESPTVNPLPPWTQLPLDRRRELTATLAALILKQLPPRPMAHSEARNEQP